MMGCADQVETTTDSNFSVEENGNTREATCAEEHPDLILMNDLEYARRIQREEEEEHMRITNTSGNSNNVLTSNAASDQVPFPPDDSTDADAQLARMLQEDEVAEYRSSSRSRGRSRVRATIPGAFHVVPPPAPTAVTPPQAPPPAPPAAATGTVPYASRRVSNDGPQPHRRCISAENAASATTSTTNANSSNETWESTPATGRRRREQRGQLIGGVRDPGRITIPMTTSVTTIEEHHQEASTEGDATRRNPSNNNVRTSATNMASRLSSPVPPVSSQPMKKILAQSCHGAPQTQRKQHPGDVSLMDAVIPLRTPLSKSCHGTSNSTTDPAPAPVSAPLSSSSSRSTKQSFEKEKAKIKKKMINFFLRKPTKKQGTLPPEAAKSGKSKEGHKPSTTSCSSDDNCSDHLPIQPTPQRKKIHNSVRSSESEQAPSTQNRRHHSDSHSKKNEKPSLNGEITPILDAATCPSLFSRNEGIRRSTLDATATTTTNTSSERVPTDQDNHETTEASTKESSSEVLNIHRGEEIEKTNRQDDNENETESSSSKAYTRRRKQKSRLDPDSTNQSRKQRPSMGNGLRPSRLKPPSDGYALTKHADDVSQENTDNVYLSQETSTVPQKKQIVRVPAGNSSISEKNKKHLENTTMCCCVCNEPVEGQRVSGGTSSIILALEKAYHRDCFRCFACHEKLGPKEPFTFTTTNGTTHPMHKSCHIELFGMKCTLCQNSIPRDPITGKVLYTKHPFFSNEVMCPTHSTDATIRRCTGCHRFEPIVGTGFLDLTDNDRCVCSSCVRSGVVLDNNDAKPLWDEVLHFLEQTLGLTLWEGMHDIPILIVEQNTLTDNAQSQCSAHGGHNNLITRGLCLTEHQVLQRGISMTRINLMARMKYDPFNDSFTRRCGEENFFVIPEVNTSKGNSTSSVIAILCLAGLPSQLTASILAHEAIHAWIKMHPHYVCERPISPRVEEGVCQLVAYLYLSSKDDNNKKKKSNTATTTKQEGTPEEKDEEGISETTDNGESSSRTFKEEEIGDGGIEPSDEKLRQYFKFSIETDNDEIYGDGFRDASKAYSALGIEPLLSHIVRYRNFPDV